MLSFRLEMLLRPRPWLFPARQHLIFRPMFFKTTIAGETMTALKETQTRRFILIQLATDLVLWVFRLLPAVLREASGIAWMTTLQILRQPHQQATQKPPSFCLPPPRIIIL